MEKHNKAYECDDWYCECHTVFDKHCPLCGELYLYDPKHPEQPCNDCGNNIENDFVIGGEYDGGYNS